MPIMAELTANFFSESLIKKPMVCLLNPYRSSMTKVEYRSHGSDSVLEMIVSIIMKNIDTAISPLYPKLVMVSDERDHR